jgi:23S rRNA pseudouridine1911/1915/1917 synthase
MQIDFVVDDVFNGKKVFNVLKGPMKLSSRLITRLKKENGIVLNGRPARTIDAVHIGDTVSVILEFNEESYIKPEDSPISIIYEDDCLLAVNKGPHTPVHTSAWHQSGTLAQAILWYYQKQGLSIKIRPINRLDRDTSGLTLFAKNSHMQDQLVRQMKENRVLKEYLGIVHGNFDPTEGTIRLPIARKEGSILERTIDPSGDDSITHYKTLETSDSLSLIQFILETGRTHQIRVHSKAMGHPILGDWLYSDITTDLIDRQALHAHKLSFDHPLTGERIDLTAPLPEDMKRVLAVF